MLYKLQYVHQELHVEVTPNIDLGLQIFYMFRYNLLWHSAVKMSQNGDLFLLLV